MGGGGKAPPPAPFPPGKKTGGGGKIPPPPPPGFDSRTVQPVATRHPAPRCAGKVMWNAEGNMMCGKYLVIIIILIKLSLKCLCFSYI